MSEERREVMNYIRKVYRFGKVYWKHPLDNFLFKDRDCCVMDYNFSKAWKDAEND